METRLYSADHTKCDECGESLGSHQVWQMVFSDDPPAVVERAVAGKINLITCPHCGFDGGSLWPPIFLYIVLEEERAVCVTMQQLAAPQFNLLREAFASNIILERGLNPVRLLRRTKIVYNYRDIAAGLEVPIEQVEQENDAILEYLGRKDLRGRERIERLIESTFKDGTLDMGVVSLEADEYTPEFLTEIEQYRETLTGDEDPRVAQLLEQLIEFLNRDLVRTRKRLPRRDEMSALAKVVQSTSAESQKGMVKSSVENYLQKAKADVLQLRLLRLCELQAHGQLHPRFASPIDLNPDLLNRLEELISAEGNEETVLSEQDLLLLPEIKKFISSLSSEMVPEGLSEAELEFSGPPPTWFGPATEVLDEIGKALQSGPAPNSLLDKLADNPLAKSFVYGEIGERMARQGERSGAMYYLSNAIELVQGHLRATGEPPDDWTARLDAVCLERMGRLQLQYRRLEEGIRTLHLARSIYERIGARDGLLNSLRGEAAIWVDLGQFERAEEMYARVVSATEGGGRADELRDLMNLANVYRHLYPWLEAKLDFTTQQRNETQPPTNTGETGEEIEVSFEKKGGIGVSVVVEGRQELSFRDLFKSEQLRLLYRALAVATLAGDAEFERNVLGRLVTAYSEQGCSEYARVIFDQILKDKTLENLGFDVQIFALNQLRALEHSQQKAGDLESVRATREEELQLLEFILAQAETRLPPLVKDEMYGEKACLLEALGRAEEARDEYRETIKGLERSRSWMRDPENKKGLQSRRWLPYVRAVRNSLRMHSEDPLRPELLREAWYYIQAGRSRAMLDAVAQDETSDLESAEVASVRPGEFAEVSARLAKDLAVLEYVLMPTSPGCQGNWALFVVEPGADQPWLAWQERDMERVLAAQRKLADIADEYENTIVAYGFQSASAELEHNYISALETLADVLLPAGLLEKLHASGYRRLVIVADAYLHEVPFAALRPMHGAERGYLGIPNERGGFQLIYAPSSSIFAKWVETAAVENGVAAPRAALFVDPLGDLSEFSPAVAETFSTIELLLQGHRFEVARLDGKKATPDAWLKQGRECNLVVYFGHSIAGPEHQRQAALTLSDGADEVALITADSIYQAATRALFSPRSLFVFASCSSGFVSAGSWDSDRELRGLSAAHLHAGCGAVIAASRPLLDSPTLVLLKMLLTEIMSGVDAAGSLAAAQMKLAASPSPYAHPHFWGYVGIMGTPDWRFAD